MAFLSLTDISFDSVQRLLDSGQGLGLGSEYTKGIYRFPSDVGNTDRGHYMVINVNTQRASSFGESSGIGVLSDLPTVISNRIEDGFSATFGGLVGGIVSYVGQKTGAYSNEDSNNFSVNFTRTIKRSTDTIALYMPDTLLFQQNQSYPDLSLTGTMAAMAAETSAGGSIWDSITKMSPSNAKESLKSIGKNMTPFIANKLSGDPVGAAAFAAVTGTVVNPMLELIYSSPEFRSFQFDFKFYPRDEKEAVAVQNIINRLYFHQSPEVAKVGDTGEGFFLVPPSEFDISFYYNGKINPNIPKISTCVLTGINVNYAPQGFAAYEVQGENTPSLGRTGMPVAIEMTLMFKETEIMTKNRFQNAIQSGIFPNSTGTDNSPGYVTDTPYTTSQPLGTTTPLGD